MAVVFDLERHFHVPTLQELMTDALARSMERQSLYQLKCVMKDERISVTLRNKLFARYFPSTVVMDKR